MAENTEETSKKEVENRENVEGYTLGHRINLDKKMSSGQTLREELELYLSRALEQEIKNQEEYVNSLPKWTALYKGIREKKNWPFKDCANVFIPLIRSTTDTIYVRQHDNLFNKAKIAIVLSKKKEHEELAKNIEEGVDWFLTKIANLKKKIHSPLLQAIKTGTGLVKIVHEEKKKTVYRWATEAEIKDPSIVTYDVKGTKRKIVKAVKSVYSGPNIYPIDRADWVQSSDHIDLEKCAFCGFKFYLRTPQVRVKARQGLFFQSAVDELLPDEVKSVDLGGEDTVQELRAAQEMQRIEPVDVNKPIPFWELWVKYDIDEDGQEDDIVITYQKEKGLIVDAIYHPLFTGTRPFVKLIFYPVEYSRDGEGTCQILESINNEINTLHNQRIDRITEINAPFYLTRDGSGLERLDHFEPGSVYPVQENPNEALAEFRYSDTVFSSFQEEDRLISMGDRAMGITPISMGQSTAERPVAKETALLAEETNKKFKYGTENIRDSFIEIIYKVLEQFSQFTPTFRYEKGSTGLRQEEIIEFPTENIRDLFDIRLQASNEIFNSDTRREINLMLYQLLSDYMTKAGTMAQAIVSPEVPDEFKQVIMQANDIGVKILKAIIDDFPVVPDSSDIVLDLRKNIDLKELKEKQMEAATSQQAAGQPPQPGAVPPEDQIIEPEPEPGAEMGMPMPEGMPSVEPTPMEEQIVNE